MNMQAGEKSLDPEVNIEAHWRDELATPGGVGRLLPVVMRVTKDEAKRLFGGTLTGKSTYDILSRLGKIFDKSQAQLRYGLLPLLESVGELYRVWYDHADDACLSFMIAEGELEKLKKALKKNYPRVQIEALGPSVMQALSEFSVDASALAERPRSAAGGDRRVIVAVIDAGIGFLNARFRSGVDQTRFEAFWAMDVPPAEKNALLPVGKEYTKDEINRALEHARRFGLSDDEVYERLGVFSPGRRIGQPLVYARTHGTHVADIAAGYDFVSEPEIASERPLIGVQLPRQIVADTSGALMEPWLSAALNWVFAQARRLSDKPLPLVVNFSYGVTAGPVDGSHPVVESIDNLVAGYGGPCHVVVSAGNSYQSRAYAQLTAPEIDKEVELQWRVLPDDKTASFVRIELPETGQAEQHVEVSLDPPPQVADSFGPPACNHYIDWSREADGSPSARIYHQVLPRADGKKYREVITLAVAPTADEGPSPAAPAGVWTIGIRNLKLSPGSNIDCRVQRDDTLPFFKPAGRQSYFDDPHYQRFHPDTGRPIENDPESVSAKVRRSGTLNIYATGKGSVAVGGYRQSDGKAAIYSAAGAVVAAVSDVSPAHRGVLAAGTLSGSVAIQSGTSVAAPAVTRWLADYLATGQSLKKLPQAITAVEKKPLNRVTEKLYIAPQGGVRLAADEVPAHRRRVES